MIISDREKEDRKDRYAREIFPIVVCEECGVEHDDYDCPNCGHFQPADEENTCPRCNQPSEDKLIESRGGLIEGKYGKICEECGVAINEDAFNQRHGIE